MAKACEIKGLEFDLLQCSRLDCAIVEKIWAKYRYCCFRPIIYFCQGKLV